MRFEDKTAIVAGGASGIGKEVATRFVAEGGPVVINLLIRFSSPDMKLDPKTALSIMIWCLTASVSICLSGQPSLAHDYKHPEFNEWYKSLKNPNIDSEVIKSMGCCSQNDCHVTQAEIFVKDAGGHKSGIGKALYNFLAKRDDIDWELTEWRIVPHYAILQQANPTGEPVIATHEHMRFGVSYQITNTEAKMQPHLFVYPDSVAAFTELLQRS